MNNYDLEHKMNSKADNWKVNNLEYEIRRYRQENDNLQREIDNLANKLYNLKNGIEMLVDVILEKDLLPEYQEILYNVKNQ